MLDWYHGVSLPANWDIWLLSGVLVLAAAIDGWQLKVPNWITFPLIVGGRVYSPHILVGRGLAGVWWARSSGWDYCFPPMPLGAWAR